MPLAAPCRNHQRYRSSTVVASRGRLHSRSSYSAASTCSGRLSRVSAASRECAINCRLTSRSTGPLAGGAHAPSARGRLAWFVRRHQDKWRHYERPRSVRQLPMRSRRLQGARTISPLRPLSLRALSESYGYRSCLEHLRRPRKLRMARRSRVHKTLRSPIGAKLRHYLLHRLRFALTSSHSEWPRNGHSRWLTR